MKNKPEHILLAHGSGGKLSHDFIDDVIIPLFSNTELNSLNDSAVIRIGSQKIAFTTDSYIIDPVFFPGGNIGRLAVCGTVNDLAMVGAKPQFLSLGLIIEEGFPFTELEIILESIRSTALEAEVTIVTGDTKIVPRGAVDKIFINTAGIGYVPDNIEIGADRAKPGDKVLLSGTMGDHGISVLSRREGLSFETLVESDAAPLNSMVSELLDAGVEVHVLRDPTRGGVAGTLVEIAAKSNVSILLDEKSLPIIPGVAAACEILGLDPLHIANEGKFIAVINDRHTDTALKTLKNHPLGKNASIIGEIKDSPKKKVLLNTLLGSTRIIDLFTGEQLPRIC